MEDEVVIAGIAGRFPGCDDVETLKEMLFNKISGVTSDNRRWDKGELGVPHFLGKLNDPYNLDLTFFGVHSKLGESMDPQTKLVMEVGFSAICDAGVNPSDLAGSNTATLIGSSLAETEYECLITKKRLDQTILSHAVSMQAHRIAYYLDLRGPSYVCDSSWNGGLYVLRYAKDQIARGLASGALVVCTNLIFMPQVSYHYHRLGRLNADGKTKCFSNDADGYARSEGCVAFFLQRKENALRNYGTLIGVNSSLYGSKNSPLSDCSDIPIANHLRNLYQKCKIDPSKISYLEASGCASKVVDASELNAVSEVFLTDRKEPLLIGSIKSNVGHTEAASGCLGVLKTIIASEYGMIPPNLYYSSPNSMVPSLVAGKLKVVTEPTPLEGDYLAVSNMSATGDFGHAIIRKHSKTKKRQPEVGVLPPDGIPRLVLLSGREENGLAEIMKRVEEMPIDEEFIALTHRVFGKGIKNHIYRGFTILDDDSSKKFKLIKPFHGGEKRPLWFVFTGMGSQWAGMAGNLMTLPSFAKCVQFCHNELKHLGVDVIDIVTNTDQSIFNNVLNAFVGITTIQVALIDLIKELGLEPDGIVGHSFGELACAYCDGSVTAQQAILAAYNRGKISIEAKVDPGLMAAVGLGYEKLKKFGLPDTIDIACHNSEDSCTISGPLEDVKQYVDELQEKGIFARSVATGGIAYHSRYIQSLGQQFRDELRKIIPTPKVRSSKWISSSVPEDEWESDLGKYSSAEYHTNNLLNSVLFEEACAHIPKNAVVIEIAPHGLLQAILKRMLPQATHIPLTNRAESDSLKFLLAAIGKMFTEGVQVDVQKLYPPVEFPVSRGTPSLATLLNWNNAGTFRPWTFLQRRKNVKISREITFSNNNYKHEKFSKCFLNGAPIILSAAYISTVLEEYLKFNNGDLTKIIFQGVSFKNLVKYEGDTSVFMSFLRGSGVWEICKGNNLVAAGKINTFLQGYNTEPLSIIERKTQCISAHQVYTYLSVLGYSVHPELQLINNLYLSGNEVEAEIKWTGDWLSFLDAIFKIVEYFESIENNELELVSYIERITIDLSSFPPEGGKVFTLIYNMDMGFIWGQGIEILLPYTSHPNLPLQKLSAVEKTTEFLLPKFVPYLEVSNKTEDDFFQTCLLIILDNLYRKNNEEHPKLHVIKILENISTPDVVNDILRKQNDIEVKMSTVASDTMVLNIDLSENTDSFSLIISGSSLLDNTLKVLNNSEGGFLIYKGPRPPTTLAIISKQIIKNESYFFCKTVKKQVEKPIFIIHDNNWKSNLINHLNQEIQRLYYFVNKYTSLAAVHDLIEQTTSFKNPHLLRFLFTDSDLSSFNFNKYKDYLEKDLRINIFLNGKWGTSLLTPVKLRLSSAIGCKNVFQFLRIKCPDLELQSLGLNPVNAHGNKHKQMLFEYSGIHQGQEICGLATMNDGNFHLKPDPHFMWIKPKNWTHDEICSVLVNYTLAYYILEEMTVLKHVSTILVHEGMTPLSQAVINLAIRRNLEVFTTYNGKSEHKEYLKNKYPQIHEDNILNYNQSQLEIPFLLKTMGKGFDVIVNTLPDTKKLEGTLKCLAKCMPKFFQVTIPSMESTFSIGLGLFLLGTGMHCIYPEALMKLPNETKIVLRDVVSNGLKNGEIKHTSFNKISSLALNIDVTPEVKHDVKKKFIVSMKDQCINTTGTKAYVFDSSKSYLIIGNREDGWLNLLEWLIKRGVRKFILSISSLSTVAAQKLNTILTINDHITVTTCSSKKLDSTGNVKAFINRFENGPGIDTAFIIGEENQSTINQLAINLPNTRIIVVCYKSGIFQENQNINSRILIIKTPKCPDYNEFLKAMDSLIGLTEPVIYIKHSEKSELDTDSSALRHWQHIPTSLREIASLPTCSKKTFWKELRTSSSPFKYYRETSPVFILPSLKKGQMKELISSLFHPAFEAVLPSYFENADDLVQQLFTGLEKFPGSVFTIICSDWMWMLGLKLGTLLEKSGKTVSLMLLGNAPQWAKPESVRRVYDQVIRDTSNNDLEIHNQVDLEKGLVILQERVRLITCPSLLNDIHFKGFCHLINFTHTTDADLQLLSKSCQRNVNIYIVNEADYLSMLKSNETTKFINSNVLSECKDSARMVQKDYENVLECNLSYLEE
ncbi:fatty acid synthase [Halyomorpha halys]|uniref:fatty acid synthase n=1 Tax=Halyomorpha halys TaxID=286706 RepID=UPI0034D386A0